MSTKRESFNRIRTMRNIRGSLDQVRWGPRPRTLNEVMRGEAETAPGGAVHEAEVERKLESEKKRFKRQMDSLERSHHKLAKYRQKLANSKDLNSRLMKLRWQLGSDYWRMTDPHSNGDSLTAIVQKKVSPAGTGKRLAGTGRPPHGRYKAVSLKY